MSWRQKAPFIKLEIDMFKSGHLRKRASMSCALSALRRIRRRATLCALALAAAGLTAPDPVQAQSVIIVRNDLGGSVENRLREIAQLQSAGTRVEIRGQCTSACTMFLGLPNACVTLSSRLGFHGPQSQYYGISLPPDDFEYWSRVMADHYPGTIRDWFMAEARQTTMGLITISGSDAIRMGARACG